MLKSLTLFPDTGKVNIGITMNDLAIADRWSQGMMLPAQPGNKNFFTLPCNIQNAVTYNRCTFNARIETLFMTEREYNECVNQYADNVFRFIVKNLRHEEDAKDIVQSAFEKLWRNKDIVENSKCKSYLFTVAYNQMIDHLRKVKRIQLKDEFHAGAKVHHQPVHNLKKALQEALNRLNEVQKSLVMLKDYEGYSYEEIGHITGLNEAQVKVYLHRARLALRNYLVSPENVM